MNTFFLFLIAQIIKALELRLIDYDQGGFLPPEKRGLRVHSQVRLGWLISKLARIGFLDDHEATRNKLLMLSKVLKNEYPGLPRNYFTPSYKPKRG